MVNGMNTMFNGNGAVSPHGWSLPSGSHMGNKNYYRGMGGGGSDSLFVDIKNVNTCHSSHGSYGLYDSYGCGGYDTGIFGGGCCGGGSGIDDKTAGWIFGISAGVGLLASPLGESLFSGIGSMFKGIGKGLAWCGKGIGKAATWTYDKILKPTGKAIGQAAKWTWNSVLKPVGQGIGNFFKGCWNWITGKGWDGTK